MVCRVRWLYRIARRWVGDCVRLYAQNPALPAAFSEEHDGQCHRHDPEILDHALPPKVLEVVVNLSANVIDAHVVRLVDLCPSRDAGFYTLTHAIIRDVVA